MPVLSWILLATLFGGLLSAALAASFLLLPEGPRARALPHLISFATGAMLAAALLVVHLESPNFTPRALPGGFGGANAAAP